jgi:serine/threonine-protein kinase
MTEAALTKASVRVGEIIAGKYRVERVLGEGGMAIVVAAHHQQLETTVAIKVLLSNMSANPEAVALFGREARASASINSEHVARVFDVGTLESGAPYMVMEFLDGIDLATWLEQRGPLPVPDAIDFVLQACEGIAEVHGLGIVHRDLKPGNLFCVRRADGRRTIKVLDFGISKFTCPVGATNNNASSQRIGLVGTPFYMSPEHLAGGAVDGRTDVWALGVILYELLTGKMPFEGETLPELTLSIVNLAPVPVRTYRPEVPGGLQRVILQCLEKDRERRYRDVAELASALMPYGHRNAQAVVDWVVDAVPTSQPGEIDAGVPPALEPAPYSGPTLDFAPAPPGAPQARDARLRIAALSIGGLAGIVALAIALHAVARARGVLRISPPSVAIAPPATFGGVAARLDQASARVLASPDPPDPGQSELGLASSASRRPVADAPASGGAFRAGASSLASEPPTAPTEAPGGAGGRAHHDERRTASMMAAAKPPPGKAPASAGAKPDCDPNFYYDGHGDMHFKPECFLPRGP